MRRTGSRLRRVHGWAVSVQRYRAAELQRVAYWLDERRRLRGRRDLRCGIESVRCSFPSGWRQGRRPGRCLYTSRGRVRHGIGAGRGHLAGSTRFTLLARRLAGNSRLLVRGGLDSCEVHDRSSSEMKSSPLIPASRSTSKPRAASASVFGGDSMRPHWRSVLFTPRKDARIMRATWPTPFKRFWPTAPAFAPHMARPTRPSHQRMRTSCPWTAHDRRLTCCSGRICPAQSLSPRWTQKP